MAEERPGKRARPGDAPPRALPPPRPLADRIFLAPLAGRRGSGAPPATTVRRDFGAPHGIFVGKVVSYAAPFYTVQYDDGDSEEMLPERILRLRRPIAVGLDPERFPNADDSGAHHLFVHVRLGGGSKKRRGHSAGVLAQNIEELPPLPEAE